MIHFNNYFIENPKATIIIVHGIAEHSGRYDEIAKLFNKSGYDVITYDHLGHGKSSGSRGKIRHFREHIEVLHEFVLSVRSKSRKEIVLLGHSMGGGIVNIYASIYQDVDYVISVAAATQTPKNAKLLRYIGFWYLRWIPISTKIFDDNLALDPSVLKRNKKDDLMLKKIYISLIGEMFIKGVNYLHNNIDKFNTPVLYLHGMSDKIVDYNASVNMFNTISSIDKEIKLYDGEYHEILNDFNKDEILGDILGWLDNRIK